MFLIGNPVFNLNLTLDLALTKTKMFHNVTKKPSGARFLLSTSDIGFVCSKQ